METSPDPVRTAAWSLLEQHASALRAQHLSDLMSDTNRFDHLSLSVDGFFADFSRNHVTTETLQLLADLGHELNLEDHVRALFAGERVNNTEARAALHTSLRATEQNGPVLDGQDIAEVVSTERSRYLQFAESIRQGQRRGAGGRPFERVVNIGIGGSDLGPRFVTAALADSQNAFDVRFVAGLDGMELRTALEGAAPETTLFVVCSKTFSTLETLSNAHTARAWLRSVLPADAVAAHFAAVSVNATAMDEFGVADDARFALWDWVGGRYSLWSPVGLSAAIAIGADRYSELLAGAAAMDEHFRSTPIVRNMPALHGLLTVWQQNFMQLDQRVVLPYDQRLSGLPDYLQQLWMESLGKSVRRDGTPVTYPTGASLWGNNGSSAQHSFAQWLHQGSAQATVDYIGTVNGHCPDDAPAHLQSLANMLAQAEVLAYGYQAKANEDALAPHRMHPGNRPSTIFLLHTLSAHNLGMLLALYEHSVYVQSVIWGVNPFDQYGVERGKQVAGDYAERLVRADESELPPVARQILQWRVNKS